MARKKVPEIFVPISRIMLINHFLLVLDTQRIFHEQNEAQKKERRKIKDDDEG